MNLTNFFFVGDRPALFIPHSGFSQAATRKVLVRVIVQTVAAFYNVSAKEMVGNSRAGQIMRPRHVAMYLAKTLTRKSYPDIGRIFDRDHTTVISAVRKIEREMIWDDKLSDDVETLEAML